MQWSPGVWAPRLNAGRCCEGVKEVRVVRGLSAVKKLRRRSFSPAVGFGGNPAAARVGVAGGDLGKVPGVGKEPLRGPGPTVGRWGNADAAAPEALFPQSRAGVALRWSLALGLVGGFGVARWA